MHAVALDSRRLALDLHSLLSDLERIRFRPDPDAVSRFDRIHHQLAELVEASWPDEGMRALRPPVDALSTLLSDHAPDTTWARSEWRAFRAQINPAYEQLAKALATYDIHVPSLRPTNYARNIYHVFSAGLVVVLVEWVLTPTTMIAVAAACLALALSMEISRRFSERINDALLRFFRPVAHPHEAHRVNSATWYVIALLILALCFEPAVGVVAVTVLGLGDPAAALFGRRFGRIQLISGRTLEGSLALVVAGSAGAYGVLTLWHPSIDALPVALSAAVFGAAAEVLSRRVDDNLSIPLAAAIGAWLVLP